MTVCPYMARYYDFDLNSVDACDFCNRSRLQKGNLPACVEDCPRSVLFFGDLQQEKDPIGGLMEEHRGSLWLMRAEKGCRPNLFYASVGAAAEKL